LDVARIGWALRQLPQTMQPVDERAVARRRIPVICRLRSLSAELENRALLTRRQRGVYEVQGLELTIRVIVANELPEAEHNAMLLLFQCREELLSYGRAHYQPYSQETSSLLLKLFTAYSEEPDMPDKLKEFVRQTIDELLRTLPAEERLKGLPAEELSKRLSPEERLKGLSADEVLKGLPLRPWRRWPADSRQTVQVQNRSESVISNVQVSEAVFFLRRGVFGAILFFASFASAGPALLPRLRVGLTGAGPAPALLPRLRVGLTGAGPAPALLPRLRVGLTEGGVGLTGVGPAETRAFLPRLRVGLTEGSSAGVGQPQKAQRRPPAPTMVHVSSAAPA